LKNINDENYCRGALTTSWTREVHLIHRLPNLPFQTVHVSTIIMIQNFVNFLNAVETLHIHVVPVQPFMYRLIRNPSVRITLLALEADGSLIRFIKNPSKEMQRAAVGITSRSRFLDFRKIENRFRSRNLKYIHGRIDNDVLNNCIRSDGTLLRYIAQPSKQLCMIALQSRSASFQYIRNPDEELEWAAVAFASY